MSKPRDYVRKIDFSRVISMERRGSATFMIIATQLGYVFASTGDGRTELSFIRRWQMHTRFYDKEYSPRYCAILASRFIFQVTNQSALAEAGIINE